MTLRLADCVADKRNYGWGDMRWPDAKKQQLPDLVNLGLSAREIGALLGYSKGAVVAQCRRNGFRLARSRSRS
jgi:hypothetical protein